MGMLGVNDALIGTYRHATSKNANKTQGTETNFADQLKKTGETADGSTVDTYMEYLKSKYGNVRIQSVGKDQESLDRIGKSMSGSDVVIAPNILEQMANIPAKAAYYEQKIDYFFHTIIPRETAFCAAQGLVFEPCGVVVHEDGTVTYICGCSDSPERIAEVNAINKAKREKEAAQRKANIERGREAEEERERQIEMVYRQKSMAEFLARYTGYTGKSAYAAVPELMGFAVTAYDYNILKAGGNSGEEGYTPP